MSSALSKLTHLQPCCGIPGVLDVQQDRSYLARNVFIEAGMIALNSRRFDDLHVADIAEAAGQSVGGFYSRFEDKEAFFRALCATTVENCNALVAERMAPDVLSRMSVEAGLETVVDLMTDIFTARWRGVLREALSRILNPENPWEPMRDSARDIVRRIIAGFAHRLQVDEPEKTLRFCFQAIVGVLQNDLVNDYHVYTTRDQSLRSALKSMVIAYATAESANRHPTR